MLDDELTRMRRYTKHFDPYVHPDRYQEFTRTTVINMPEPRLPFLALGITGEAGEVADKIKKGMRGDYDLDIQHMDPDRKKAIALELGDNLWYISNMAHELGYSLSDIMTMNVEKLVDRRARGVSHGDGDNR